MPVIRIDDDVWGWLTKKASERPFEDTTPNAVLRRIAGFTTARTADSIGVGVRRRADHGPRGDKTPQQEYRIPILEILLKNKGRADRSLVLKELERQMSGRLTAFDRKDIKSGTIRWQKSAEWEVSTMRQEGLLLAQSQSPRGVWCLSAEGEREARAASHRNV